MVVELRTHTAHLRECVQLLSEATSVARIDIADLLVPLFSCRGMLAASEGLTADAVLLWLGMVEAAEKGVRRKGLDGEMVLTRLREVEAILLQILECERTGAPA